MNSNGTLVQTNHDDDDTLNISENTSDMKRGKEKQKKNARVRVRTRGVIDEHFQDARGAVIHGLENVHDVHASIRHNHELLLGCLVHLAKHTEFRAIQTATLQPSHQTPVDP